MSTFWIAECRGNPDDFRCACVSATLLFALSPTVRVAAQLPGNWSMALRCIALFLVRGAADALMVRELRAHLGDVALAAGPIDGLSIVLSLV